jgi:energy-coupling factor transport system ATP-binding protein
VAIVEIDSLTYAYGGAENTPVLRDCSLNVSAGEMVLLVGPSGCGKSTLLRAVNGLVPHFYGGVMSGHVRIDGADTRDTTPAELAHRIGCVFQDPEAQIVTSTVYEEVVFGLENLGVRPDRIALRAREGLSAMGASHLAHRSTRELSGGEIQRVALAAALAMQPAVLVLDEPTSQLDPAAAETLLELLRRINEESGIAVLIAEHRLERCYHWADRVVTMADGQIVCDLPPRESARWSVERGSSFVPPVTRLFAGARAGDLPLTVKEGRAELAALAPGMHRGASPTVAGGDIDAQPKRAAERPEQAGAQPPAVAVDNLYFTYPDGVEALCGCDLVVSAGELVSIMGDNGAGKSTLIRHLNGLNRPQYGSVRLLGRDVSKVAVEEIAPLCAVLGQNPNDYLFCDSVTDELMFSLKNLRPDLTGEAAAAAVADTLELLGIAEFAEAKPRSLSVGQRQRVAIASMMVADPTVLVLDEPTRGLDWDSKATLGESLRRLQARGKAVIVVTHDVEFAATYTDRAVVMGVGLILADGPTAEIMGEAVFLAPQVARVLHEFAPGVITVAAGRAVLGGVLGDG